MGLDDIKAPPALWALGAGLMFAGFYQLSHGLNALFDTVQFPPFLIVKTTAGVYLLVAGITLSFIIKIGRVLVVLGAVYRAWCASYHRSCGTRRLRW